VGLKDTYTRNLCYSLESEGATSVVTSDNMPQKSHLNVTTCTCSLRNPLQNLWLDPYLCILLFGQPWQQVANDFNERHPHIRGYP
jgi:hypothetical protein